MLNFINRLRGCTLFFASYFIFSKAPQINDGRRISVKMVLLSVSKTSRSIKVMDLIASDAGTVWETFSKRVIKTFNKKSLQQI